ncbi:MAG: ABC transporter permease [Propionibacteriaceae bacterium]|jgi:ABC-type dipeptide/oligopeptide/nickel transport system permease component|nr:ABC transporter permease [Propionibacteriaceae bacterium]
MAAAARWGKRLGGLAIVFLGVTFIIYLAVFALPGDPIRAFAGDRPLSESVVSALRAKYHLDDPLWRQYLDYLLGLFQGDLGQSFSGRPVAEQLANRWPVTVVLALTAWVLEIVFGLGLGVVAALKRGSLIDHGLLALTVLASCVPVFVLGVLSQQFFGVELGWLPVAGVRDGWPLSYILPASVIAVFGLSAVSRLMRGAMVENLEADYVRTVRAHGFGEGRIVGLHVMRNSLIPASTYLATDLGYLLGGSVIIEGIFNLPGVGNLLFDSIRAHEGPTVVGIATALIVVFLLTSVLVDALHALLDPRVRRG